MATEALAVMLAVFHSNTNTAYLTLSLDCRQVGALMVDFSLGTLSAMIKLCDEFM